MLIAKFGIHNYHLLKNSNYNFINVLTGGFFSLWKSYIVLKSFIKKNHFAESKVQSKIYKFLNLTESTKVTDSNGGKYWLPFLYS